MALKKYKPVTPGQRHKVAITFDEITTSRPEKSLLLKKKRTGGRNDTGKMTIENVGGGHKKRYRIIDFKRDKKDVTCKVATIEYDPNRTANIALLHYVDGEKRYIIAPDGLKVGMELLSAKNAPINIGNTLPLSEIPLGTTVHNVELRPKQGGILARSAGSSLKLVSLEGKHAQIAMPSGEARLVSKNCYATIGQVSNVEHNNIKIGKAGRKRHLGRRPQVRGKAMNPVDHPHGGGEGGSPIGMKHPKTPWGLPALGFKTRKRHYTDKMIIKDRRRK